MAADLPVIRDALRAWMEGDLVVFEQALAPDAKLLWYEPGAWDCEDRESIMRLLRRKDRGDAAVPDPRGSSRRDHLNAERRDLRIDRSGG